MKTVVVNADDFGRLHAINRGIIEANRRGIVTSTTVMIGFPPAADGLAQARREAPHLGLGLHLTLTAGRPVSAPEDIPSLVDSSGQFYPKAAWAARFDHFERADLEREIAAQIARFTELAGQPPDHLDAHDHITYLHPHAFRAMLEQAHALGIPIREVPMTMDRAQVLPRLLDLLPGFDPARALDLFDELRAVANEGPAPFCPAKLTTAFWDQHATLGDLLVILTTLPEDRPLEIMCHPGLMDDELAAHQGYSAKRQDEFDHLPHRATLECVQSEGIRLVTFADLARE